MQYSIIFLSLLLWGCSKIQTTPSPIQNTPPSICKDRHQALRTASPCTLSFNGLCSSIDWLQPARAEKENAFCVKFWKTDSQEIPEKLTDPKPNQVTAFARMKCCGSIQAIPLEAKEEGLYLTKPFFLSAGEWDVFVQIQNGSTIEKKSVFITLD